MAHGPWFADLYCILLAAKELLFFEYKVCSIDQFSSFEGLVFVKIIQALGKGEKLEVM